MKFGILNRSWMNKYASAPTGGNKSPGAVLKHETGYLNREKINPGLFQ